MRTSGSFVFSGTLTLVGQEAENKQNAGELVTDRPDFTESTEVAPKGWLQWESGVQFDKAGDAKGYISGAPLLRFGIAKRFELRLSTDGMVGERDARAPMRRGLADAGVGFKYKLRDESKWLPAFSVIPAVSLPMGHRAFTSSRADPGVKFAVAKDVSAGFELSSNFNFNAPSDGDGRYHQNAATISVGHGFGERFAGY